MRRIPMIVNVLVDDDDFERLSQYTWGHHGDGYAVAWDAATKANVYMHRVVMGLKPSDDVQVDHINRCRWDNRKENLRLATRSQNLLNVEPAKQKVKNPRPDYPQSPYKGVYWMPHAQKWGAQFRGAYIGLFMSDREAAVAYDAAAIASGIEGVWLNFADGKVEGPEQIARRTKKGHAGSTSSFAGVSWNGQHSRWQGSIKRGDTVLHLGFFDNERDGALVYDEVARLLDGPGAKVNFPDERCELPAKLHHRLIRKGVIKS